MAKECSSFEKDCLPADGSLAMQTVAHEPRVIPRAGIDENMKEPPGVPNDRRRRALPGVEPKSVLDDPDAANAVAKLLASESYREADQDLGFLQEEQTRGLRLQLEYLKVEMLLRRHSIDHTIVVFGSTRIIEPRAAQRHLDDLTMKAGANRDPHAGRQVEVARRLVANSRYYEIAREFGRLVGRAGMAQGKGRTVIMTGGGPGIMEAANRGAHDVGALSVGLNVSLPQEQYPNPYVTPDLCFRFRYFALRKLHFALRARALVVFPGGFGTMDELFEILELSQTRKTTPVPVILVGETHWRRAFDPDFLIAEGMIEEEDRELFWYAETAEATLNGIQNWYRAKGAPLLFSPDVAP
jgi:uncharacterized protein (TIGR00730 family)